MLLLGPVAVLAATVALDAAPATPRDGVAPWTFSEPTPIAGGRAIAQDALGYLWVGSSSGLDRWDGSSAAHSFPFAPGVRSGAVFAVTTTPAGDAWAGLAGPCSIAPSDPRCGDETPGGPGLMRVRAGVTETIGQLPAVGAARVSSVVAWQAGIWLGTSEGLVRAESPADDPRPLARVTFRPVRVGDGARAITALAPARDGRLWIGASDGVWALRPGGEATRVLLDPVRALAERDGALVAGTARGAVVLERGGPRWLTTADGLPSNDVRALTVDAEAGLWIGTWAGLARWDGARVTTFDSALADERVVALAADRERGVWIGTRTGTIVRAARRRARTFGAPEGLPGDPITSVLVARDGSVVATSLSRWLVRRGHDGRISSTSVRELVGDHDLGGLVETADGRVLVGTRGAGVLAGDGRAWRPLLVDGRSSAGDVRALLVARDGRLWLGDAAGGLTVLRLARDLAEATTVARHDGCPGAVTALAEERDGRVWATSDRDGVAVVDAGGARCRRGDAGLPPLPFAAVAATDDGTIWLGSPQGKLVRHRTGRFVGLDETDGLPCDAVAAIVPDGPGHLWFTCGAGAVRVATADLDARADGGTALVSAQKFDRSTGMRAEESSRRAQPTAARDADGTLWVATIGGLAAIAHPDLVPPEPPPRTFVSELWLDDVAVSPAAAVVRARRVRLKARLVAVTLMGAQTIELRRRLVGPDVDVEEGSVNALARFGPLGPGTYALTVAARNASGLIGPPTTVPIRVLRPLYLHPATWAGALALLAAAALAVHRGRVRGLLAKHAAVEAERSRIARDLHDDLGQGFTAIRFHAQAIELAAGEEDERRRLLERLRRLVARVEEDARRAVWNLRAHTIGAATLADGLRALVAELASAPRGETTPAITLELPAGDAPLADALAAVELLHVAREAVTNALRHAAARTITVTVERDADELRLAVHDDGRGFDPAAADPVVAGHFGLLGMRERLRRLGGVVTIDSSPGAGTTVLAVVPARARDLTAR